MQTILRSEKKTVQIDTEGPVVIIGEKINPTGHKKMAAALQSKDYDYITNLATLQVASGADVLDVNVGVPDLDNVTLMPEIVKLVAGCTNVPLCLDSPSPAVLAAGLAAAPGKPLVNSVSGEEGRLQAILPLVKDRGAAVIGLIMDDTGIPATPEGRLAVAERILERAAKIGIPAEDVVIDPLVMAVGSDSQAGVITLQTIRLIREKLGVNINLGASNVSFGLPDRLIVNMAFMALAVSAGATCVISDPMKLTATVRAADLLLGRDEYSARYLRAYRQSQALLAQQQPAKPAA
jgi:5-methyltetrahydrofolate--homocysteine methyltransferase